MWRTFCVHFSTCIEPSLFTLVHTPNSHVMAIRTRSQGYGSRSATNNVAKLLSMALSAGVGSKRKAGSRTTLKNRRKKGQSYTKTQTRKKKRVVRRAGDKSGGCYSSFSDVKKPNKYTMTLLKNAQPYEYVTTRNAIYSSTSGLQFSFNYANAYIHQDLIDAQVDQGNSATGLNTSLNPDLSSKTYIQSIDWKTSWTNNGLMPIELILFTCKVKLSMNEDPITTWNRGVVFQGDPQSTSTAANAISAFYGETPHRQVSFNKHFWIVQWKKFTLAPGEVHTHTIHVSHPRGIQEVDFVEDLLSDTTVGSRTTFLYKLNYSMAFCGIVRGFPAALNTAAVGQPPVASLTDATIAPASVIYASERRVKYKFAVPTVKSFHRSYGMAVGSRVVTESDEFIQEVRAD